MVFTLVSFFDFWQIALMRVSDPSRLKGADSKDHNHFAWLPLVFKKFRCKNPKRAIFWKFFEWISSSDVTQMNFEPERKSPQFYKKS
jgi:hypothetical protein